MKRMDVHTHNGGGAPSAGKQRTRWLFCTYLLSILTNLCKAAHNTSYIAIILVIATVFL